MEFILQSVAFRVQATNPAGGFDVPGGNLASAGYFRTSTLTDPSGPTM